MNFLRKILLIAIISVFAENAECAQAAQTIFDLPENTPGLMKDKQIQKVCGQDKACVVHIVVPKTNAELALKREDDDDLYEAMAVEGNIYFPADGTQPTTEEAVKYSCANVNDDAITNWYMQMFGVQKYQNEFLFLGLDLNNNPYRILDIDNLSTQDPNKELPKKYATQQDAFIQNFKEIASTSVGRTLLYRILIEIRRNDGTIEKKGCLGNDVKSPLSINERNNCRYLKIKWEPRGNSFNLSQKIINFGVQFPVKKSTTLGNKEIETPYSYYKIILYPRPDDVGLLHEMIHWYHLLRHTKRYYAERTARNGVVKIDGKKANGDLLLNIGNYYWPSINENWKFSAIPWVTKYKTTKQIVNFEEIRTILGLKSDIKKYINGDDLSENLYRSCKKLPLRFGHGSTAFYEDEKVIDKVISVCGYKRSIYSSIPYNCIAEAISPKDEPMFQYTNNDILRKGIGCFKIQQIGIESIVPD